MEMIFTVAFIILVLVLLALRTFIGMSGKTAPLHFTILNYSFIFGGLIFFLLAFLMWDMGTAEWWMPIFSLFLAVVLIFAGIVTIKKARSPEKEPIQELRVNYPELSTKPTSRGRILKKYFLNGEVNGKPKRYEISMVYFRKLKKIGIWDYPYCHITYDPNIKAVLDFRVE